ncbi:helix-turn-helix transcriptional regulator [Paenibacillus filicis]|uniref:Helix-turn-helix transcriptional regulator n=1 Tax=Paenibacillus gyeongsangnamensis TaxID=3388067 RepID=A0ABT4Q4X0_9BACL|nr:helix-turn-helix transcriptional regulator [Paenibacillus filicis]MCZ8511852.1 helix-turn-helix transcriptional regulator [Paenibacillus filicis]
MQRETVRRTDDFVNRQLSNLPLSMKTIGIMMTNFLLQTRIHHAKLMLQHTAMPISEIAEKTGFNSFSYFGKTFKTYTGATPREFRKTKNS